MTEQISSLPPRDTPQPGDATAALARAKLERDQQRQKQRGLLFWGTLALCLFFYAAFFIRLCGLESLISVTAGNPYALWLIALLALVPTILLLALMKGVYRSTKGEPAKDTDSDLSKNLPPVVRIISDKLP